MFDLPTAMIKQRVREMNATETKKSTSLHILLIKYDNFHPLFRRMCSAAIKCIFHCLAHGASDRELGGWHCVCVCVRICVLFIITRAVRWWSDRFNINYANVVILCMWFIHYFSILPLKSIHFSIYPRGKMYLKLRFVMLLFALIFMQRNLFRVHFSSSEDDFFILRMLFSEESMSTWALIHPFSP